jgi:hypothetical protein
MPSYDVILHIVLVVPRRNDDELPQFWDGKEEGHYNTAGKVEHPEHIKPIHLRKVGIS